MANIWSPTISAESLLDADWTRQDVIHSFRHAVDNHAIIAITNRRGVIIYANELFCQISGYSRDQLVGRTHRIINSGHHPPEFWRDMWVTIASGGVWHGEVCNRAKDGTRYWVDTTIAPLRVGDQLSGYIAVRHPITAFKKIDAKNKSLQRRDAFREAVLDTVAYAIVATTPDGLVNVFNRGAERLVGYRAEEVVDRLTFNSFCDPNWFKTALAAMQRSSNQPSGRRYECECILIRKDGARIPVFMSLSEMRAIDGQFLGYMGVAHDISEHKRTQEDLRDSELKFRALYQVAPVGIVRSDPLTGRLLEANPAFHQIFGLGAHELVTMTLQEVIMPGAPEEDRKVLTDLGSNGARNSMECECVRKDGTRIQVLLNRLAVTDGKGRKSLWFIAQDITGRKEMERKLRQAAQIDSLTGLANRALLCERLTRLIHATGHTSSPGFTVLYLDVDYFKHINDSLGHLAGDQMLLQIASRLRSCLRVAVDQGNDEYPTIARLGGDEFVVVLDGVSEPADIIAVAERLIEALSQPYRLLEREFHSSVSIGIVTSGSGQRTAEEYLRDADIAMYEAKSAGRGRFVNFDAGMHKRVQRRLMLQSDLHRAMHEHQLAIVYQPLVCLNDGRIRGCEALLRWRHPQLGSVSPAEFIPIAEETGIVLELSEWILRAACAQYTEWRRRFRELAPESISVNISRAHLTPGDFERTVGAVLRCHDIEPERLRLEITETAMMRDPEAALQTLQALHSLGVRLDLDDFGTGYSSLSAIHLLPIDGIKIDRSFVQRLDTGRGVPALIEAVVHLARSLNMEVIAEGIETPAERERVRQIGCHMGQGYLFAPPLQAAEFAQHLLAAGSSNSPG